MSWQRYFVWAVVLVTFFLTSCETMNQVLNQQKPTARLTGLKFEDATLDSATLLFDVEIDNHYPAALPLTNFDYSLASGADTFLSGTADTQTTVPAKSSKTISLPAKIDYIEMLKALKTVRPGSKIPYNAELGLSIDAPALGLIRLPLKKQGELVLPSISDTNIKDIWDIINPR